MVLPGVERWNVIPPTKMVCGREIYDLDPRHIVILCLLLWVIFHLGEFVRSSLWGPHVDQSGGFEEIQLALRGYAMMVGPMLSVFLFTLAALTCVVSRLPGFCYLQVVTFVHRLEVAWLLGYNPLWSEVAQSQHLDHTACYEFRFTGAGQSHVWRSATGEPLWKLYSALKGARVGHPGYLSMVVNALMGVYMAYRLIFFLFVMWMLPLEMWILGLLIFSVAWLGRIRLEYAGLFLGVVALLWFSRWSVLVVLGLYLSGNLLTSWFIYSFLRHGLEIGESVVPDASGFPTGITGSGLPHRFVWTDRNGVIGGLPYAEDGNLVGDVREALQRAGGYGETVSILTGNTHRVAASQARYFRWMLSERVATRYVVNVGGTFKGWDNRVSGVALQPTFSDSDAANLLENPSVPGLGQMVINDWIATDCGAVGSPTRNWNPMWGVQGVGGAVMTMVHCYDIPVKALLGAATCNGTETVFVVMHGSPSVFADDSGMLPWSGQYWTRSGSDLIWRWASTPGRTWKHNYRMYYEHFFTDYVQTLPGVWYVSDIHRMMLDTYLIRWTRTTTKPDRCPERQLTIKHPVDLVFIPTGIAFGKGYLKPAITGIWSIKSLEEYVHESKDFEKLGVNFRALTDTYIRTQSRDLEHEDTATLLGVWDTEVQRRKLMAIAFREEANNWWSRLVGLSTSASIEHQLVVAIIALLKRQPQDRVVCGTLVQENPYLKELLSIEPLIERVIPPPPVSAGPTNSGFVAQSVYDTFAVKRITRISGKGDTIAEQLCSVLFGKVSDIGPLLPLGEAHLGGSRITATGTGLLLSELEYLTSEQAVVLVLRDGGRPKWIGRSVDERPVVIEIDLVDGRCHRIHYPLRMTKAHLCALLDAEYFDLAEFRGWPENFGGTDRAYEAFPDYGERTLAAQQAVVDKKLSQMGRAAQRDAFLELNGPLEPLEVLVIPEGSWASEIPILEWNPWIEVYDGQHPLPGSPYPAPHHFAGGTVAHMRRLRVGEFAG